MTLLVATQITAVATAVLAVGAVITAVFAFLAFRKQSVEVTTLQQEAAGQQELTRQQGELLKVQSKQLEIQRQQLADQSKINAKQSEVLELQATELRESLEQRKREAAQQRRAQAERVFMWEAPYEPEPSTPGVPEVFTGNAITASVRNTSEQPIYDVEISWHLGTAARGQHGFPTPLMPGDEVSMTRQFPENADPQLLGAVVFFRDAAGVRWRERPDGQLDEVP